MCHSIAGAESGTGQFLPRVGIAYRWNDKTVLRGGYGQSADPRPFQDVRNAYPIANIWSMPVHEFNGVDNAFHSRDHSASGIEKHEQVRQT